MTPWKMRGAGSERKGEILSYIVVTSLARLHDTVKKHRACDLVTLINADTPVDRPFSIADDRHLFLGFNDITTPIEGMLPPSPDHVEKLLEFAGKWNRRAPLAIHCFAGISRSTAAAYICALALNEELDEEQLALELRKRAPSATPNIRLIGIADDILGRDGRMVRSIEAIGRGEEAFEGIPFMLPLRL
jgi:predicted protein tyrosine phosphatase